MGNHKSPFEINGKEVIITELVAYMYCPTCKYHWRFPHSAPKESYDQLREDLSKNIICSCNKTTLEGTNAG